MEWSKYSCLNRTQLTEVLYFLMTALTVSGIMISKQETTIKNSYDNTLGSVVFSYLFSFLL